MPFSKPFDISQKDNFNSHNRKIFQKNTKDKILKWKRTDELNYMYDAKFEGNILVVGRIGCGKTTFVQKLGKNRMFVDINEVVWISKISLSNE